MKKLLLFASFVVVSFTASAQFSGGVSLGLPTGDVKNASSLAISADLNYMFNSDEDFTMVQQPVI